MDWRRIAFYRVYTATTAGILGLVAVYETFALAAMYGVIFILFLLCLWVQRRRPIYFDGDPLVLGGDRPPSLPPPGKRALPPPGAPQIGRSNRALTKHRPALPERSL